jgi:hypothetical protein
MVEISSPPAGVPKPRNSSAIAGRVGSTGSISSIRPKEREAEPPPAKDLSDPRDVELRQRYETSYSQHWHQLCEKEVMRRWRVLHTLILEPLFKLALEEEGDDAMKVFMAYALLPDGSTVGETMEPQLTIAYETGAMPALGSGS